MSRKARESAASRTLLQHIDSRSTGRLTVGTRSAEVSVWVLNGSIVAATSPNDELSLIRLASLAGELAPDLQHALHHRATSGASVFGDLLEGLPGPLADRLLGERFRANLVEYVGSMSKPVFVPLKAVFVDNFQVGHDSQALIAACAAVADQSNTIDLDAVIEPGPGPAGDDFTRALRANLGASQATVGALLAALPFEPVLARGWIQAALDEGIVVVQGPDEPADDWSEDDATEHDADPPGLVFPISEAPESDSTQPTRPPWHKERVDDPPTPDTASVGTPVANAPPPDAVPALTTTVLGLAAEADDADAEDTSDAPSVAPEHVASVRSWLSKAHAVEDDELGFFEDHDSTRRGGSEDGSFTTGQHNLEKLEVNLSSPAPPEEVLEADEAPTTRYSAPTISEGEASDKVAVINTVLQSICQAFDRADGPGRGRTAFQLLIEGSPTKYQSIFDGVQVDEQGTLPPADIIGNLLARPATEQRLLLTQALSDLIDRALSSAADDLPDEEIDALLEDTAGYRGRLGL